MSYIRAEDVLPSDVLAVVQNYVDGEMLYVPMESVPAHLRRSIIFRKKAYSESSGGTRQ